MRETPSTCYPPLERRVGAEKPRASLLSFYRRALVRSSGSAILDRVKAQVL
jgi:hypothetical protein